MCADMVLEEKFETKKFCIFMIFFFLNKLQNIFVIYNFLLLKFLSNWLDFRNTTVYGSNPTITEKFESRISCIFMVLFFLLENVNICPPI